MAKLIRSKDWSTTPLGPLEEWSDTLVASVNIMLASPNIFGLYWEAEQTLLYNDAYCALLHEKHPSALGTSGREVWAEAWDVIGPQITAAYEAEVTTSAKDVFIPIFANGKLRDGWFSYVFHPVYEQGRVVGVGNSGTEDTALRQARASIEQAHEKLHLAMQFAGQGAFFFEERTGLITVDAMVQKLFEMPETAGPAEYWISKVHEDDQQMVGEAFAAAATGHTPYDIEHRVVRSDGVRWIQARAKLISKPGEPVVLTGICEDTTERKRQRDALQQTEKLAAVGKLAASIAHEINNPLESVTNLLYLAKLSDSIPEIQEYLDTAEQELRRVSAISGQTLRFYKQPSGPREVTSEDLFSSVLSIYQGRFMNARVTPETALRDAPAVLCFDGEIRQVLNNLVGNAIDAMQVTGGRLLLRSRKAHDWRTGRPGLRLTVADTGPGMPPNVFRQMFEAFYTTKGIGGTGLGLWISKDIMDRHEGRLQVRTSVQPGHSGTVFVLFLPFEAAIR